MPSLVRRRLQCRLGLILADIAALFSSFALTGFIYLGENGIRHSIGLAQLLLPVFLTVALYNGAYSMPALARARVSLARASAAMVISSAVVVFIGF